MRTSPLGGRRPRRDELAGFVGRGVQGVLGPDPKLLIVGINPGLWTAAVNAPFAYPGNRFWPSMYESGLLPRRVDASTGLCPEDEQLLIARGVAMTNLVDRATARADELTAQELQAGRAQVTRLAAKLCPKVVAIVGITAYRIAFEQKRASLGRQQGGLAGAELWVIPQPSGLNAHATMPVLIGWWHQVGKASGLL